jgi:putative flippase GtrA
VQSDKSERKRQLTFLVCGGLTTLVAAGVFVLAYWICGNWEIALALDYVCGTAVGYLLNRYLTFGAREVRTGASLAKYVVTAIIYFALHLLLMEVLVRRFEINVYLAFLAFFVILVMFYSAQKVWVFKHKPA